MSCIRWNQWLAALATVSLLALAALSWSHIARADAVLDWNAIAVNAIATASPPRPGPVTFLDLAVVQAAVYDAVQAIDGKFKPYHVQIPGASGSPEAAAAKAAHDVLVNIVPAQAASLDTTYREYLTNKGLAENNPGVAAGQIPLQHRELFACRFGRDHRANQIGIQAIDTPHRAARAEFRGHDAHRHAGCATIAGWAVGNHLTAPEPGMRQRIVQRAGMRPH